MHPILILLAAAFALGDAGAADSPSASASGASAASRGPGSGSASAKESTKDSAKGGAKDDGKDAADNPKDPRKNLSPAAARALEEAEAEETATKLSTRLAALRKARAAHSVRLNADRNGQRKPKEVPFRSDHWSYEGQTGPANWGKINSAWTTCATGKRQSPIDIRDGIKVDLEQIAFEYRPTGFNVTDNGHTVQVEVGQGNSITVMGRMYDLVQFHFHRPSEERVNGRGFEMVVHLVHKDPDGKLAVIAVLIERGKAQSLIQTVWNNLPLEKYSTVTPSIALDMNELLPAKRDYYTFMGSLTTPPCTEDVLWMVMKEPVQASGAQLAIFSRLYPLNARPTQNRSGRLIKESN